jgi:hypothetical protein
MDRLEATHLAACPPRNDGHHFRVECFNADGSTPLRPPSQVTTDCWTARTCSARGRLLSASRMTVGYCVRPA